VDFWDKHVVAQVAPAVRTPEEARALFAKDDGTVVYATPDVEQAVERLRGLKNSIKALEAVEEEVQATVMSYLGAHSALYGADGSPIVTWKRSKDSTKFDVEAFQIANPAMYAQYLRTREGSRRFLIK